MTTLKLNTLSARIQPIKWRWCISSSRRSVPSAPATIRRCISGISINRSRCAARWRWLTTAERTIWIKHDELIVGNRASEVRAAPIFPEYTVSWIEKEIDDLADRPGAGFSVSEENKRVLHEVCPWWRGQTVQDRCYGMFTDEQRRCSPPALLRRKAI